MTEREKAMREICVSGFAADEARLFLDTHPADSAAMAYYDQQTALYREAVAGYEKRFGPITAASGVQNGRWAWGEAPWPWEGGNR